MHFDGQNEMLKKLILEMRKLSTRMVLFQQNAAHSLGVVHTDFKTADILNETGPITAGELGRITGLSTGAVTALIDRLEQAGYVKREKDPDDRRKVIIVPIKNHHQKIKEHYLPLSEAMSELCSQYKNEELALIIDFIEKTIAIHEREIKRLSMQETEQAD